MAQLIHEKQNTDGQSHGYCCLGVLLSRQVSKENKLRKMRFIDAFTFRRLLRGASNTHCSYEDP